jgi:comEA protein
MKVRLQSSQLLFFACLAVLISAHTALATKKPPLKPININTANSTELQEVPGIGPVTADKILQMRKSYGAFKSVDDLLAVHGLGKKRLDKMRKYLTVGKVAAKSAEGVPPCSGCSKSKISPGNLSSSQKSATTSTSDPQSSKEDEEPQK